MVMITPALLAILDKFPHRKITVLTSNDGIRALKGFSDRIDKFLIYNKKSIFPWLTHRNIKKKLRQDRYARIYCFEYNSSYLALFRDLNCKVYALQSTEDKSTHYAQHCLNLVNPENSVNKMAYSITLPLTDQAKQDAKTQLETLRIKNDDFVIGFHPSFSGLAKSFGRAKKYSHHKMWPMDYWSTLATKIHEYSRLHNKNVIIMMDLVPDEESIGITIKQQSHDIVLYQCPPLNFERYKATLARYDLLITPDSGPMHIAAAVNTKVIALFSQHKPGDCQPFVSDDQFTVLQAENMDEPEKGIAAIKPVTVFKICLEYLPK